MNKTVQTSQDLGDGKTSASRPIEKGKKGVKGDSIHAPPGARCTEDCVIGQRGTITLPKTIRSLLGIDVGDTVRFEVGPDQIVVRGMKLIPANSELAGLADRRVRQIAKGDAITFDELKDHR